MWSLACAACRFWLIKSAEWSPRQTEGWRAHSSLRAGCLSVWAAVMKMSGKRKGPSAQGLSTRSLSLSVCVFASLRCAGGEWAAESSSRPSISLLHTLISRQMTHCTRRTRNESTSSRVQRANFNPLLAKFSCLCCLLVSRCESVGAMGRRAPLWRLLIQFCNGKCFQVWPNSNTAFVFLTRRVQFCMCYQEVLTCTTLCKPQRKIFHLI